MKNPHQKIWLSLWLVSYASSLLLDFFMPSTPLLYFVRFSVLILNCYYVRRYYPNNHLLQAAFLLTFVADLLLVIFSLPLYGLLVFCFVQLAYLNLLLRPSWRINQLYIICLFGGIIVAQLLQFDPVFTIATQYGLTLSANFLITLHRHFNTRSPGSGLVLAGFGCFIICDCFVILSFFSSSQLLPLPISHIYDFCDWAFYFPSQILLLNGAKFLVKKPKI
jgi:hypothetical protein